MRNVVRPRCQLTVNNLEITLSIPGSLLLYFGAFSAVGQQKREREECMSCVVPYFDMDKGPKKLETSLRQTFSVGFNIADDLKKCVEAISFANTLVGLERFESKE